MLTLRPLRGLRRIAALHSGVAHGGCRRFVCLIGANGAGKTTTLKTISGLVRARRRPHRLRWAGDPAAGPPGDLARGIAHCPEGRRCSRT